MLLTKDATNGDVWSYPNTHGDIVVVANASGVKQGVTRTYDPYGNPLTTVPENSAGSLDYGWLGQHQRPLEHQAGLISTIEMGARQYIPGLGRFLEVDPIEGGSANAYEYCAADPISCYDLDGQWGIRIRLPSPKDLFNGATKGLRQSARSAGKAAGKIIKKLGVKNSNAAAFGGLKYAKKYGIVRYGSLSYKLKGTGLQAHHIIEKRFAAQMGQAARDMPSIAVTKTEHDAFTAAWRQRFPHDGTSATVSRQDIMNAAKEIYAGHSDILRHLGF